ncbi:hypothetical protein QFZ26_000161 [Agromyces ramosus]|uniref:DUF8094 domain-containing protein n=1 Tax=Agromyces ramosus TaxID=33879 RepID=A0ABU0R3E3_9MICO|nr:hypothetical protein [Agromyces ramosus]
MRFVLAIVAFIAAAVMIGFGIAQRTVFLEPDRVSLSSEFDGEEDFIVLEPDALAAHPGKQTLTVSGSPEVFLSYGRSSDVQAWLADEPYTSVHYDADAETLVSEVVVAESEEPAAPPATTAPPEATDATTAAEPAPSPAGSDLWLDEFTAEGSITTTVDVPDGISVLIAAPGAEQAPSQVSIDWPLENSTPWAGPLIVGGALVFLVGIALVVSGFAHHRRSRGPRRNLPKGPRGRLPSAPKPSRRNQVTGGGRRAIGRAKRVALVPLIVIPAFALSACSADYWPSFDLGAPATSAPPTPTEAGEPAEEPAEGELAAEPAVTVPQMERIMRRVAVFANEVDASRDAAVAAERFTGPALEARTANYAIRGVLAEHPAPSAIPASPLTLTLPQQVTGWPRTVLTIAKNADDPTIAPTALVLVQESPRENYKVEYAMALAPDADMPLVAPASVGAAPISPEFKGLVMPTGQVASAYADILQNGEASPFAPMFDLAASDLDELLNAATRKTEAETANPTATLTVTTVEGDAPTIALSTVDAGAMVAVELQRGEQSVPNDGGTAGFQAGGVAAALSGFTGQSAKGVQRSSGIQLLFYVPGVGAGENEQIRLLGWSESLIAASEIP